MKSIQRLSKPFRQQPEATISNLKADVTTVSKAARERSLTDDSTVESTQEKKTIN
jgi:hypothetical protein